MLPTLFGFAGLGVGRFGLKFIVKLVYIFGVVNGSVTVVKDDVVINGDEDVVFKFFATIVTGVAFVVLSDM